MHLFSADSYKDYLLEESHKMFNEINKVSEVCVVNARNVIYNSSLSRLMYNLSVCMRLLTK